MGHTHGGAHSPVPPRVRRLLIIAIAPFIVATVVGLFLLWPGDTQRTNRPAEPRYEATVVSVDTEGCGDTAQNPGFECALVEARVETGPDEGDVISFNYSTGEGAEPISEGDEIVVAKPDTIDPADLPPGTPPPPEYYFSDFARTQPLLILAAVFILVVIGMSRLKGATALLGLGVSLLILVNFVLPAILEGSSPLAVAIVGSAAIMFFALYLAHGVNARTTAAVLGTLVSLALTGALAVIFVELAHFTGLSSEEAAFLQVSAGQINLQGLLLGGIVIGALGVLDDVTVTQSSAVWELHAANENLTTRQLYRSALNVGRDHIASTVNTLVLAYAGASLPLMILLTSSPQPLSNVLTSEVIAAEIVRTLVGSIGLVASVPVTTALAAAIAGSHGHDDGPEPVPDEPAPRAAPKPKAERTWTPPARETEWRETRTADDIDNRSHLE